MNGSLKNHFLVAMPSLDDSVFYQSVVYLCEHDEEGALGMIINRPTRVTLSELFKHLKIENLTASIQSSPVFFGGPIQKEQGMVVHDGGELWTNTQEIAEGIFLTSSSDILQQLGTENGPDNALVMLGYAGWEEGQLESELANNSWLVVPASHDLLFNTPADQRWTATAKQLGVDIQLMPAVTGHA